MVTVSLLDRSSRRYLQPTRTLAKKLMKRFRPGTFNLEIYLVGNDFMNKNVLAFPAVKGFPRPDLKGQKPLGELYLNPTYIKKHGEHFGYMVIHGFLHLIGYDHVLKRDRIVMERLEERLLRTFIPSDGLKLRRRS